MSSAVDQALDTFVDHYCRTHPRLEIEHDPEWLSPCEIGTPWQEQGNAKINWSPRRRDSCNDLFAGLEQALEFPIHPDVKSYYQRYWSANLEAEAPEGHVSLLMLWNPDDVDRLIENLIGHAMACRHNKTPFSVFFACTEPDSELFLTVDNDNGSVQLELPGKPPLRQVAQNLAEFLTWLVPAENPRT